MMPSGPEELPLTIRDEVAKAESFGRALLTDAKDELERIGHSWWTEAAIEEVKKCAAAIVERVKSMVDLPY